MTKEQLIKSATEIPASDNVLYWVLVIVASILTVSIVFLFLFGFDARYEFNYVFKQISMGVGISILCLIVGLISREEFLINKLTTSEEWRQENFYGSYLESLKPEKIYVKDIILGNDGYTVALDNDKPQKVLLVQDFEYIDSGESYIEAIWVDGLEDINIADGYYNIKLYKSDDSKGIVSP